MVEQTEFLVDDYRCDDCLLNHRKFSMSQGCKGCDGASNFVPFKKETPDESQRVL